MNNIKKLALLIPSIVIIIPVLYFTLHMQKNVDKEITNLSNGLKPLVVVTNREGRDFSLEARMKHYNVPGVSIAVISEGRLSWARGFGLADVESGRPVDENTMFRAASISKPVAAVGALCLVDRGKLYLDSAANNQLTSWSIPKNKFNENHPITLRQLLSHSAGLSDDPRLSYMADTTLPSIIQILNGDATSEPVTVDTFPGAMASYSNQGYVIVQLLMTDVMEKPFEDLIYNLVLDPCGMQNSTFDQTLPGQFSEQAATGYLASGEELPGKRYLSPALAAAGLWSTPSDLANFALAIINSYNGKGRTLLSRKITLEMLTPQAGEYGLGVELEGEGKNLCFSHGGASEGARCFMLAYPERGEGAVIMTNSDAGQGLYYEILRGLALQYDWPGYKPIEKSIVELAPGLLSDFDGTYLLDGRLELKFKVDNDHLTMISPSNEFSLYPESDNKFFEIDFGFTIEFIRDNDGNVVKAILDRGGVISTLEKIS